MLDPCLRSELTTAASCAAGCLHDILDGSSEDELLTRELAEAANLDAFVRLLGDGGLDEAPGQIHRGIK